MTTTQHGGPRPKVRDDDGRQHNPGGARAGSGPKPKSFTIKLGDTFYVPAKDKDGNGIEPAQQWTVVEITRTHVRFQTTTGDKIRLVR